MSHRGCTVRGVDDDLPPREALGAFDETTLDLADEGYIEIVPMPDGAIGVRMTEKGKAWVEASKEMS